jgi:MoaA/NifB/PqqE/SkfB family radical SAM enzyme
MVKDIRKYFNYAKRQFFKKEGVDFLILYATSMCNFRCGTCFFHKNLNKGDDLTLDEYKKISDKLGEISILLMSGGEPFLNHDLEEVCSTFIMKNKVNTLYIPTNGSLKDKILPITESLLKKFPDVVISVNPSIDGMKDYHEKLRGVPDSFGKVIETIKQLGLLKKKYKNLQIIVNSVINGDNIEDLKKLAVYLRDLPIDHHAFEIMRGSPKNSELAKAENEEIKKMHKFIFENRKWYLEHNASGNIFANFLNKMITLGHLGFTQKVKEDFLYGKKWSFPCDAGNSVAAIYPDGNVGLCELLTPAENLRENDYDLNKILNSEIAKGRKNQIMKTKCSCTHICFINASLAKDWKSIFKIPYFYFANIL